MAQILRQTVEAATFIFIFNSEYFPPVQQQQNTLSIFLPPPLLKDGALRFPLKAPSFSNLSLHLPPSLCGEWPSNARLINHAWRCPPHRSPSSSLLPASSPSLLYCSYNHITTPADCNLHKHTQVHNKNKS